MPEIKLTQALLECLSFPRRSSGTFIQKAVVAYAESRRRFRSSSFVNAIGISKTPLLGRNRIGFTNRIHSSYHLYKLCTLCICMSVSHCHPRRLKLWTLLDSFTPELSPILLKHQVQKPNPNLSTLVLYA